MPGSAINEILQMRKQGLSNNQIIQNLQRAGYSNTQIFDAMNQADTKMAVEGMQPSVFQQPSMPPPSPQSYDATTNQPPSQTPPQQAPPSQPQYPQMSQEQQEEYYDYPVQENMEQLVEEIIEEKWRELVKDVNKVIEWKNKMESRITDMEMEMTNLKERMTDLNKAIISKVNEYDKHILEVGSDLKAMEKVFSKVLPSFTQNVNELSNITKRLKEDKQ